MRSEAKIILKWLGFVILVRVALGFAVPFPYFLPLNLLAGMYTAHHMTKELNGR